MLNLKRYPGPMNDDEESYFRGNEELDEYYVQEIPNCYGNVYYWYCSGSYDGDGVMILESTKGFDIERLSHCSCNGPCSNISKSPEGKYKDLQEIIDDEKLTGSEDWQFKRLAKWALTGEIDKNIKPKKD